MKVVIKVWRPDKPHGPLDAMPNDTILEYDGFEAPEVLGHGVPMERCCYKKRDNSLQIRLDEYPTRVDADPRYQIIHLLNHNMAKLHTTAYTLLSADRDKGIILWANPNVMLAEVS